MANVDTKVIAARVSRALQNRDRLALVDGVTALIDARAPMTNGWKSLSGPLIDYGELTLARRVIDLYADAADRTASALFDQAMIYTRTGKAEEAQQILSCLEPNVPDQASNAFLRGTTALNRGAFQDASSHLLAALSAAPTSGQIALALSQTGRMDTGSAAAAAILDMQERMVAADQMQRVQYLYALGKVHDDRGDHAPAFEAFAKGADIMSGLRPYDAARDASGAKAATAGYAPELIASVASRITAPSSDAIIVTGSPRSGSTLVEQILASHSAVSDGAELGLFRHVIGEMKGVSAVALQAHNNPADLTDLYLRLARERFPSGRFVDKSLDASRYLGALAALLPDAPIIWMRRDPLDCAWSCFRTFLLRGADWSWSLPAIAQHFMLEETLLQHWRAILGSRILEVDYAALVGAPADMIPVILAHCGLAPEARTLTPELTQRVVTTSSVAQVRQPINAGALGTAEPYRKWLGPFLSAYNRA